mgnify:CR=1 FL=1
MTLLSCVGLCTQVMAGEDKKGDRDEEEDRSISHDPVKVEIVNDGVMLHFMVSFDNVFIQVVPLFERLLSISSPQSYYIPVSTRENPYLLIVSGDDVYQKFPINL